jgi:hypothetical protein
MLRFEGGMMAGGNEEDYKSDMPVKSEGRSDPGIASYAMESTAARAFASLVAPMPEPEPVASEVNVDAKRKPGGMTQDMIRRIADRAEAAARKK